MSETSVDQAALEGGWEKCFMWLAWVLPSCVSCPADPGRRVVAKLAARAETRASLPRDELIELVRLFGLEPGEFKVGIETSSLPCIALLPSKGLGVVREHLESGVYLVETVEGLLRQPSFAAGTLFLSFESPEHPDSAPPVTAKRVLYGIFFARKAWIVQLFIASALASFLLLSISFYTMQVYDRVVANGGIPTLIVLTVGVLFAIVVEYLLKLARMTISHAALSRIEIEMSTRVFGVMLGIRLEAFPALLGALSAQLRGFESVKAYLAARTTFFFCELPFCLFFLGVIYFVGGPLIMLVPTIGLCLALAAGLLFKRRIHRHARREQVSARTRQGHLIETLNNIELIKAHGAEWRMQGGWNALSRKTVYEGSKARAASEAAASLSGSIHQLGYISLVGLGAYFAVNNAAMTIGTIVACSILSGRVYAPIGKLPSLLVQWGHAAEALEALEKLFARYRSSGSPRPLLVSRLAGSVALRDIAFAYEPKSPGIRLARLDIAAGEKVAILGRVGAGKSTLLKMIAGLIKPSEGQILIDGLDVFSLAPQRRAELIGYLGQTPSLIEGTLRENLLMGNAGLGDDELLQACKLSGLAPILATREQGLETAIHEGGKQFSGGETQLIALTRLFLNQPRVWLLDEPTTACDAPGERHVLAALKTAIGEKDTLVLVTHRVPPLDLVERIVVIDGRDILADGPKAQVLEIRAH